VPHPSVAVHPLETAIQPLILTIPVIHFTSSLIRCYPSPCSPHHLTPRRIAPRSAVHAIPTGVILSVAKDLHFSRH
jgi:hypothetical protein